MSTITDEMKLKIDDNLISKAGFNQLTIDLILRERLNSILTFSKGERIIFPSKFSDFTPMGNPPKFMAGYAYDKEEAYLSIFKTRDTAIQLSAKATKSKLKTNPIFLIDSINKSFEESLIQSKKDPENVNVKFEFVENVPNLRLIRDLENFDTILYSLLAKRKIVIIGRTQNAVKLLETIYNIIPDQFKVDYGFSINLPYIENASIVIAILDPEMDTNLKEKSDEFLENEVDIIDLSQGGCYGQFTCEYTQRLWQIIKNSDDLTKAYELVDEIVHLEQIVNESENAQQFGDRLNVKYDNADLIIMMKQNNNLINGGN